MAPVGSEEWRVLIAQTWPPEFDPWNQCQKWKEKTDRKSCLLAGISNNKVYNIHIDTYIHICVYNKNPYRGR
ncbi:rCG45219 [Rattus norvegicus]|uniref:RCG45219 n=1 Tax=Rattus norvegicus TaxID=10116 RepID=A6KLQ8_RAT|nr:rCG45219 [Rattus norvegicus]